MTKKFIFLALILIIAISYFAISRDFEKTPDTFYINANILTINELAPNANAMIIRNGKISEIGDYNQLKPKDTDKLKIVDLQGKTVMPGFIDSHTHVALSAFLENMVDLSGFTHKTNQQVWDALQAHVNNTPKGEWIVCRGLDPILTSDLHSPDLEFLDSISPDNPLVLISQSLHTYWANSAALAIAGINQDTPDPSPTSYYQKDANGNLTGLIAEQQAFIPVLDALQKTALSSKALVASTSKVFAHYAKNGNTTVVSTGLSIQDAKPLRLYQHVSSNKPQFLNQLLAQLGLLPKRTASARHFIYMRHDRAELLPDTHHERNDFYDIIGIKHWYDGAPYTGSMYLKEPYLDTELSTHGLHIPPNTSGRALITHADLLDFIKTYHQAGWQIAIHAQGDNATAEVVDAFAQVNADLDISKGRHRIEHALLINDASLQKMPALGLTPNFHINHLYYYGQALDASILGPERANKILPIATADKLNLKYAMHADQPMFESNPFHLIQTAVLRQTKEGQALGAEQAIDVASGLQAMTLNAAYQINMETKIGSLETGKYADFIVLDKNPLAVSPEELTSIQVLETYVNGNRVSTLEHSK